MTAERRELVERVFEAAMEHAPSSWEALVEDACGDDEDLRGEVWRLLRAHQRGEGLLERSPLPAAPLRGGQSHVPGEERVGRYRILRELGKGGMGKVYLAERADGHFRQRVALKVIPRADPELRARVIVERQILAALQHPNIGRLLDGGVTEDGRPFLVMEHVDGLPVDVYCDRMRLSLRQRLRVFLTVLKAVEHAHHNLVVHRDLKPSNILVTPPGEVKLLDFGIAKLLNPDLGGAEAPVTRAEDRALTPEYASPEQVRGEAITTSADIYCLGVVLYEILTGYRPYQLPDRTLPTLMEVICQKDPVRPSERVTEPETVGESRTIRPETVAEARHTTSARLRRQLRGDLDAIVMKALRKEPERRYGSVELLSQDILHYLDGHPVQARRGSRWYRIRKVLRRHRGETLAAAVVVVSLVLGAGLAAWQGGVAARERDKAREALRQSSEVTDFLLGLFEASDPLESPGDTVTALDLLRRGERRANALTAEPAVKARMLQVMARAHENLGSYRKAVQLADEAWRLLEEEYGPARPEVADALVLMGSALRRGGQYDSAHIVLERAVAIQEAALGSDAVEISNTLEQLSRVTIYLGDLAQAEREAERSLALREAALEADDPLTLNTLSTLASIYRYEGRYAEAEASFRDALRRRRSLDRPDPTGLSTDLLQLGDLLRDHGGSLEEAEKLYDSALALLREETGEAHRNVVWGLTSLAALMERKGDPVRAESLYVEAVDSRRRTYGELHPLVGEIWGAYGSFLTRVGRLGEAEGVLRRAMDVDLRTVGPDHTRYAGTLTGLAENLVAQGRLVEADSAASRALRIRLRAQGRQVPIVAQTMSELAGIRILEGRLDQARALLDEALQIVREQPSVGEVPGKIHANYARLYDALGLPEEAARHRILAGQSS